MHGTRHYIVFVSSLEMVINREINLEFLDYCLSIPKEDIHMIHKNMFFSNLFGRNGCTVSYPGNFLHILRDVIALTSQEHSQYQRL